MVLMAMVLMAMVLMAMDLIAMVPMVVVAVARPQPRWLREAGAWEVRRAQPPRVAACPCAASIKLRAPREGSPRRGLPGESRRRVPQPVSPGESRARLY